VTDSTATGWFLLVWAAVLLVPSLAGVVRLGGWWGQGVFSYLFALTLVSPLVAFGSMMAWFGWRRVDPVGTAKFSAVVTPRIAASLLLLLGALLLVFELWHAAVGLTNIYYGLYAILFSAPGLLTGAVVCTQAASSLRRQRGML
jgi:hypothetical protein